MPLWTKNNQAFLIVGSGDTKLMFTAVETGASDNDLTVTIVNPGTPSQTLGLVESDPNVTINLATDSNSNVTSTIDQVIALVNANSALITASTGRVGPAPAICPALVQTNLAGGKNQSAPNWVDSFPAHEGWRNNLTGENLVASSSVATLKSTQALVKNSFLVSDPKPRKHYQVGTFGFNDMILLAVEYDKPVYIVQTNVVDSGSNSITIAGDHIPANITVNLIDPGVPSSPLSGSVQYIPFNDQLIINLSLATNGGSAITTTKSQLRAFCTANNIPFQINGSGTVTAAVLTGPWTHSGSPSATLPITIGSNTRSMTLIGHRLDFDRSIVDQNASFDSVLPVPNEGTLLFGYTVVSGDVATAGNVQIGTGAVAAFHDFGTSNSEILFTSLLKGIVGNNYHIALNAPVSVNNPTLSVTPSNGGLTETYNLTTTGGVAATVAFGSSNTQIRFTAKVLGVSGNSITITISAGSGTNPLTIGVVGNAITVNLATTGGSGTSTVTDVINAIAASGPASALVLATTTGDGTGLVAVESLTSLATGADAASNTTVATLIAFVAANSAIVSSSTSGNGSGNVQGASSQPLTGGLNSTVTITFTNGSFVDNLDNAIQATFSPLDTSLVSVN